MKSSRRYATVLALGLTGLAFAAEFQFPSPQPPRGLSKVNTPIFICLGFDDNSFTGSKGTGGISSGSYYLKNGFWEDAGVTDASGWGVAWIRDKLLSGKTNPDGTPCHASFYQIAGQSEQYYNKLGCKNVVWGREEKLEVAMLASLEKGGHEVGSHTLDHLEVNAISKKDGQINFQVGTGGQGEKMVMPKTYCDAGGQNWADSAKEYPGTYGWMYKVGEKFTVDAWTDVLKRADESMKQTSKMKSVVSFRAPRLEYNANMFTALKGLNYLYDCSLEEGQQEETNGSNFLWPYTVDNGSPGLWAEFAKESKADDLKQSNSRSWPQGLWELPTHVMIVPVEMRKAIYDRVLTEYDSIEFDWEKHTFKKLNKAPFQTKEIADNFLNEGTISGLDFNFYVDWLFTPEEWLKVAKYNLDLRVKGNRAPFVYGCHSQYYHPAYDFETLKLDVKFHTVLTFSNYKDRAAAYEEFVKYAQELKDDQGNKLCYFTSGKELVDWMKAPKGIDKKAVPAEILKASCDSVIAKGVWEAVSESKCPASVKKNGGELTMEFTPQTPVAENSDGAVSFEADKFNLAKLENLSFTYASNQPFALVITTGTGSREARYTVVISHQSTTERNTGIIAIRDFVKDVESSESAPEILDPATITQIGFEPRALQYAAGDQKVSLAVKDFKLYGADLTWEANTPIANNGKNGIARFTLNQLSATGLHCTVPTAQNYSVKLFALNGRLVRMNEQYMSAGIGGVSFPVALAPATYLVRITGADGRTLLTKAMVH